MSTGARWSTNLQNDCQRNEDYIDDSLTVNNENQDI